MTSPAYSISFSVVLSGTETPGAPGDVLIKNATSGLYTKATAASRGTRRSTGIALSSYVAGGAVDIQQEGEVAAAIAGLGAGTATYVRVSAAGSLERVASPAGSDDVVGWVETDGTLHLRCGQIPGGYGAGGGGGGATLPIDLADPGSVTGILPTGNQAAQTVAIGSQVSGLATGVAAFLGTPTSANLLAAVTNETGTGALAFATAPTLTDPVINGQKIGAAVAVAALAIDWTLGTVFTKTLSAGANTFTFSNAATGRMIQVCVTGAASTLTWPTVRWPGGVAPTQTASGTDVYTFFHDGTNIYGTQSPNHS